MLDHFVLDVLDCSCSDISMSPLTTKLLDTSVVIIRGMASIS